jgi:hypothetical protein
MEGWSDGGIYRGMEGWRNKEMRKAGMEGMDRGRDGVPSIGFQLMF